MAASPVGLVAGVLACMGFNYSLNFPPVTIPGFAGGSPTIIPGFKYNFEWPSLNAPGGFPSMAGGFCGSMLGGVGYVLKFLPPKPDKLPSLPTIGLFVDGFMGSVSLPALPATNIIIPGLPSIPFPGSGGTPIPGFNASGMLGMIGMFIGAPFLIITSIVESVRKLQVKVPTFSDIVAILTGIGIALHFPAIALAAFMNCLVTAAVQILSVIG